MSTLLSATFFPDYRTGSESDLKNADKNNFKDYTFTLIKIILLFFIIKQFKIEKDTQILTLLPIIVGGYAIHYWLPFRFKAPFFILLSFTAIFFILGLVEGALLIIIGLSLITICHLPLRYNIRLVILFFTVFALIFLRLNFFSISKITLLLPLIGAMFMFRLVLYFYELRFEKNKISIYQRVAYFFLLPNICFPLFPIVDFKTFIKTYYAIPTKAILENAIQRIFRGVLHLIVYRFIYYYIVPTTNDIHSIVDIIQFMIFSYTLILRLSGMFHLILGILGLFGFNLPEIFNNYFLAYSFNNLWRRINTYWREFMMKIFYYPIYFKIRKLNEKYAIPITILIVFVINWFMHGYQWFWIRGFFPLATCDILFWMTFGITVMLNSMYQERYGQNKTIDTSETWQLKSALLQIIKTIGIFLFMCTIWMMWSSSSITEWLYLLTFYKTGSYTDWIKIIGGMVGFIILMLLTNYSLKKGVLSKISSFYLLHRTTCTTVYIILLFLISIPEINSHIIYKNNAFVNELQKNRLSKGDKQTMERGYYQNILNTDNLSIQLWETQLDKPREWNNTNNALIKTTNILQNTLTPSTKTQFKGAILSTNKWGMRDQEYTKEKPENTFRFAILGGSYEMGSGVNDNETFEALTEKDLNTIFNQPIEILNFAVGGYHLFQNVDVCREKVLEFSPDALLYFAHSEEFYRVNNKLTELILNNIELKDPFLKSLVERSGANSRMCRLEVQNSLQPFTSELIQWGYKTIVEECKKHNNKAIWVYLPALGDNLIADDYEEILHLAKNAGFTIISLKNVYDNNDKNSLKIADWDTHPNAKGHQLIAKHLYEQLLLISKVLNLK